MSLAILSCCAAPPSAEELTRVDIGPAPSRTFTEQAVRTWLDQHLKDPESARIEIGECKRGWYQPFMQGARVAWELHVTCNAKNSFGGYTGTKLFGFYFIGDQLVAVGHPDSSSKYETTTFTEYNGGGRAPR